MKNVKGIVTLGLTLALYAAAACVGLALVHTGTAETIAQRKVKDALDSMREIFPEADKFKPIAGLVTDAPGVAFLGAHEALAGGKRIGTLVEASGPSYSGKTRVLVGVSTEGKIAAVKILENKDTPGLGANAASPAYFVDKATKTTFYGQFKGKDATDPFEVKKDVVSITASTITSKAISAIVRAAAKAAAGTLSAAPGGEAVSLAFAPGPRDLPPDVHCSDGNCTLGGQ